MGKKVICLHHVSGYMMIDIVNGLSEKYDECILLTGELRPRGTPLNKGVKVVKLITYNRKTTLSRILTWGVASFQAFVYILAKGRKSDIFFTTNPPLAVFIANFIKNNFTVLIYDVYPDVLVQYKILKSQSLIVRLWKKVNANVFKKANRVITIGNGLKSLASAYVEPRKIEIIPCWSNSSFLKPIPKNDNMFLKENGLEGKFVVMYSGNLGLTHDVEIMLDLAEMQTTSSIHFIIIGEGAKQKMLADRVLLKQLKNVTLLPWQKAEVVKYSLAAADLAIVTLGKEASLISIPSKLYDIMAVGSPVMAICDPSSELSEIIRDYKMGESFSSDRLNEMNDFIQSLVNTPEKLSTLRSNSYEASKAFSSKNAQSFK